MTHTHIHPDGAAAVCTGIVQTDLTGGYHYHIYLPDTAAVHKFMM